MSAHPTFTRGPITVIELEWDSDSSFVQQKEMPSESSLMTYAELAHFLNTSEGWVRRNARRTYTSDPIPAVRLGKNVLFDVRSQEFVLWLKRRRSAGWAQ